MTQSLSIVFAGTPEFGLPCLQSIVEHSPHHVIGVYTQPDRPSGRGRKMVLSPIKMYALSKGIPIFQPENFKSDEARQTLRDLKPDVMVVIAYGLILPQAVLDIPKYGCMNVHASILPKWRGAAPIQHAILAGDKESGVTIMQMDKGMDTGDMLRKSFVTINFEDNAQTLHDKLQQSAIEPLLATLGDCALQQLKPEKQNSELATYAAKIQKTDAKINWHQSATQIYNLIRAYQPWPIAYTILNRVQIKIHQAQIIGTKTIAQPGTVVEKTKKNLTVACTDGLIKIERIQFPSEKVLAISDWLNGHASQINIGDCFE